MKKIELLQKLQLIVCSSWWVLLLFVAIEGIKLSFTGIPFAFIAIPLFALTATIWESFVIFTYGKKHKETGSYIFAAFSMLFIILLGTWILNSLISYTGYTSFYNNGLIAVGIWSGFFVGWAKGTLMRSYTN